jgi:hypothetical protein
MNSSLLFQHVFMSLYGKQFLVDFFFDWLNINPSITFHIHVYLIS